MDLFAQVAWCDTQMVKKRRIREMNPAVEYSEIAK
jgi:hypothetical protein